MMLEASVVVYLLQGYVALGPKVRTSNRNCAESMDSSNRTLSVRDLLHQRAAVRSGAILTNIYPCTRVS